MCVYADDYDSVCILIYTVDIATISHGKAKQLLVGVCCVWF